MKIDLLYGIVVVILSSILSFLDSIASLIVISILICITPFILEYIQTEDLRSAGNVKM